MREVTPITARRGRVIRTPAIIIVVTASPGMRAITPPKSVPNPGQPTIRTEDTPMISVVTTAVRRRPRPISVCAIPATAMSMPVAKVANAMLPIP